MKNRIPSITVRILIFMLLGPLQMMAQDEPALRVVSVAADASAPGVARLSVVQGDVSTLRSDSKDWVATTANAPVEHGDRLATGPGSRAELQLDYANVLRLDQGAEARVVELTGVRIQIQVGAGRVDFAVFKGTESDVEIDTPNLAIRPLGEGLYRLQVNAAENTQLTVARGHAEVTTAKGALSVDRGQAIEVKGAESPEYRLTQAGSPDNWDRWNDDRDHTIADAQAWQYTNRYYTGSEDLDRYGDWVEVPGYAWCWSPYVDAGWAPYRDGRWVSDPTYGWTWVGYEPWGWAPYHYGRWISYGGNWCWWPGVGPKGTRPVWGPGYVAFLGFGGRPGVSGQGLEFDSIGWLPLGPRDHLNPWWGPERSFSSINIVDINAVSMAQFSDPAGPPYGSNLPGIMTQGRLEGAITTVSAPNFADGHLAHNLQPVNESMLQQGSLLEGTLPVIPSKASLLPVNRPVNRAALPAAAAMDQHFFSRSQRRATPSFFVAGQMNPPAEGPRVNAYEPVPAGRVTPTTHPGAVGTPPNTPIEAQAARPVTGQPGTRPGWQHFSGGNRTGWQRFGAPAAPGAGPIAPTGAAPPKPVAP